MVVALTAVAPMARVLISGAQQLQHHCSIQLSALLPFEVCIEIHEQTIEQFFFVSLLTSVPPAAFDLDLLPFVLCCIYEEAATSLVGEQQLI